MKIFLITICVFFALQAQPVSAQLDMQGLTDPQLLLEAQPPYPQPGEEVTITLNDYSGGVYGASITWLFNGQAIEQAANQRSVVVQVGTVGSTNRIEAVLTKPGGGREVLSTIIKPIYLDIIIEPQTRVPDFYLGRSLPSIQSIVNATALVNDGRFRTDLVYTWRLNRQVLEGGALRGQNQVSFETPMGSESILSLQVTEPNGTVLASRAMYLPSVNPEIRFHEVNTLYGVNTRAITKQFALVGNSTTLRAEPYYLDSRVFNRPDIVEWKLNNQTSNATGNNPYEVTLQQVGLTGNSNLSFQVRDTTQVLQGARQSINIRF